MGGKTKTKTKTTPWDPGAIKGARDALNTGYGQTQANIAQWSPTLNTAIQHISDNIAAPPSYVTDARNQLDKTINGDYVNSNPYTAGISKLIGDRAQGNYNQTFGASGRSHGGLAALLSQQGVGDALQTFHSGVYDQERGRQQQAMMAAPGFHQDEYTDTNALFPAVNNQVMMPLNAAGAYAGGMGGLMSPYNTSTQTQKQGFGLAQAIGLAAQLGSAFIPTGGGMGMGGGMSIGGSGMGPGGFPGFSGGGLSSFLG